MNISDYLIFGVLLVLYFLFNIHAMKMLQHMKNFTRLKKIVLTALIWLIPFLAGIIVIQVYSPLKKNNT
ncbi:MAG: hypothetical protein JXJ22_10305 [Bacteroidales bacterium]|nr:hypothetical protein [Bacteroidales bacterium]